MKFIFPTMLLYFPACHPLTILFVIRDCSRSGFSVRKAKRSTLKARTQIEFDVSIKIKKVYFPIMATQFVF